MLSKGKSPWTKDHVAVAEWVSLQNWCSKPMGWVRATVPNSALIAGFCAPSSACFVNAEINFQTRLFFSILFICAEHKAFKQSWFPSFIFLAWNRTSCMSNQFSPSERKADEKRNRAIQCVKYAYFNLIKEKQQGRERHRTVAPRALVTYQAMWNKYCIRNSIGVLCRSVHLPCSLLIKA